MAAALIERLKALLHRIAPPGNRSGEGIATRDVGQTRHAGQGRAESAPGDDRQGGGDG